VFWPPVSSRFTVAWLSPSLLAICVCVKPVSCRSRRSAPASRCAKSMDTTLAEVSIHM
jgi:hypothetical protein